MRNDHNCPRRGKLSLPFVGVGILWMLCTSFATCDELSETTAQQWASAVDGLALCCRNDASYTGVGGRCWRRVSTMELWLQQLCRSAGWSRRLQVSFAGFHRRIGRSPRLVSAQRVAGRLASGSRKILNSGHVSYAIHQFEGWCSPMAI